MLNENAKKWVAALRSGEYLQGRGALQTKDGLCCLGVGCEVAMKEGVIKGYTHDDGFLPEIVQNWLGLRTVEGSFCTQTDWGKDTSWLTAENDGNGKSFSEIADIIESEPEGLFVQSI